MLRPGDQLLIVLRRLYEGDHSRFFLGVIDDYESGIVKMTGHSYLRDYAGTVQKKSGNMTKVFSLASGTLICYVIPDRVRLDSLKFVQQEGGETWLSDGHEGDDGFKLNLTEAPLLLPKKS